MRRFSAALVACVFSAPAWCDSDGYFCVGGDYLAFELSFSGKARAHQLHLMRFHDPSRWTEALSIVLPDFQTHGLRCAAAVVSITGWEAIYDVSWRDADSALALVQRAKSPGPPEETKFPDSLGSLVFGPPQEVALPSRDPTYSYVLRVQRTPDPADRCSVFVRSAIAQRVGGAVVREHELLSGRMPAECGE